MTNESLMLLVICKPDTMETSDMHILLILSQRQIDPFFSSFYAVKTPGAVVSNFRAKKV